MLKFFRQIRQQLVHQVSLSKYMLYALGEILLVVIGILIALQVNNWNEKRIKAQQEHELHQTFIEDLLQDQTNIKIAIQALDGKKRVIRQILKESKGMASFQDSIPYGLVIWQLKRPAFFKQKNQEVVKGLSSKKLKKTIGEYIFLEEKYEGSLSVLNELVQTDIRPYFQKNGFNNIDYVLTNSSLDELRKNRTSTLVYDKMAEHYNQDEFLGIMYTLVMASITAEDHSLRLLENNQNLITQLKTIQ